MGISRNSTQKEIKLQYYKLAQQYHPDKNPSAEAKDKFSDIQNAYATLGDKAKRSVYDSSGGNYEDIFQDFNKNNDKFRGGNRKEDFYADYEPFFNQKTAQNKKGSDIYLNLKISFEESIYGAQHVMNFQKKQTCPECKGTKIKPGAVPVNCFSCRGTGFQKVRNGSTTLEQECNKCKGKGTIIKQLCLKCRGKGELKTNTKWEVDVPKGVQDGQNLRYPNEGNIHPDTQLKGDLIVSVTVEPHTYFNRIDNDIHTLQPISLAQAVLGDTVKHYTIHGEMDIQIPKGTQAGDQITLKEKGVHLKDSEGLQIKGDHIVTVQVSSVLNQTEEIVKLYNKLQEIEQPIEPYQPNKEYLKQQKEQQFNNSQQQQNSNYNTDKESIYNKFKNLFS